MKRISKILALILALLMLVSVMAACGDKKDDPKSDSKSGDTSKAADTDDDDDDEPSVAGSEQSWGEITVFVPDSMNMQGGNGSFDPDDPKTVWLYDNDKATNYIEVTILDSEDNAKSNVEMSKDVNTTYSPEEIAFTAGGEWNGIAYDAHDIPCTVAYTVIGDKVYYILAAGHEYDSDVMKAVLSSLK